MGTFVANGQGTTGMLYRRNRYFSPVSGQFTQSDPIGIAGGMNAFGFASGDPVNFSDPFGLLIDDITYNTYGTEISRVKNDQPDRYFLQHDGRTDQLDYGLAKVLRPTTSPMIRQCLTSKLRH
jgi:RHS repeat-associated protein